LNHFPNAVQVEIHHYKDMFNRPRQDYQLQKQSLKLILAVKQPPFLYPLTDIHQPTQNRDQYYATPLLNCLYNCEYCFLQGLYPSANMVAFVNLGDFFKATDSAMNNPSSPKKPMWLSIAYQTDLLAFERLIPFCQAWIEYATMRRDLILEIRTKSAYLAPLRSLSPPGNVVLAWSLSPEVVVTQMEHHTPSLQKRLQAVQEALRLGWKVRLCIDPVMTVPRWKTVYGSFVDYVFERVSGKEIYDVVLGVFRMNREFFQRIRKQKPKSPLYYYSYAENNRILTIPSSLRDGIMEYLRECLGAHVPKDKILSY
jgi:spore photoproduct lyase